MIDRVNMLLLLLSHHVDISSSVLHRAPRHAECGVRWFQSTVCNLRRPFVSGRLIAPLRGLQILLWLDRFVALMPRCFSSCRWSVLCVVSRGPVSNPGATHESAHFLTPV
jgi:hypothetical protein